MSATMECIICRKKLLGRADKKFCSMKCKSYYHKELRKVTHKATKRIDKILHRNRSILLEIMGKRKSQIMIAYEELAKRNFKFNYITGYYINNQNKMYHIVYDFAWMKFSNGKVLIKRRTIRN